MQIQRKQENQDKLMKTYDQRLELRIKAVEDLKARQKVLTEQLNDAKKTIKTLSDDKSHALDNMQRIKAQYATIEVICYSHTNIQTK